MRDSLSGGNVNIWRAVAITTAAIAFVEFLYIVLH